MGDMTSSALTIYEPRPASLLFDEQREFTLGPAVKVKLAHGGAGTGSAIWAAGVLLAQLLAADPALLRAAAAQPAWAARARAIGSASGGGLAGATVVELGAGLGLISISGK